MRYALSALIVLAAVVAALAGPAAGEQASQPSAVEAGYIDTGNFHSCAVHAFAVRCWGYGGDGALGYGNRTSIGDDETPGSVGPVNFGGHNVTAIAAGDVHTCALLDDGTVRCWGFGANGRLGYGNTQSIGDNETPADAGPVFLGTGRTAKAISAGSGHTCAVLDNNTLRCWGFGVDGRLGYNNTDSIGDDETPGDAGPVNFGPGRTVKAVSAGDFHTCAILDDNTARCWGFGGAGRLGYSTFNCPPVGEGPCPADVGRGCAFVLNICQPSPDAPSPANMGPINLGAGRTAKAISAGDAHTCAVLDNDTVRCWGSGGGGRLGYANNFNVGDNEVPGAVGPVDLGDGRTARAITAGGDHTCAVLDNGAVRCWGSGSFGQLGYGNDLPIGADQTPGSVGPVNLGAGRTAKAISAAALHTCALLDNDSVRCWGAGGQGRLGYCNERTIGDNETPGSVGPVDLGLPTGGARCATRASVTKPPPKAGSYTTADPRAAEAARLQGLRSCLAKVKSHARREVRRARRLSGRRRARALRHARRHRAKLRRRCSKRYGRTPGRVTGLMASAVSSRRIVLHFKAPGSDGSKPPAARSYVVKQSRRPIRSGRAFRRAHSLCKGKCRYNTITSVGSDLELIVTGLRRHARYYFAVAARDNVSGRNGPRSKTVKARTR
jgi:alpha-tubulin suppressor-like RCC1 family protein